MHKLIVLLSTVLLLASGSAIQSSAQGNAMSNEAIIREFVAAWSNLDAQELANYFSEDGTYHNMPSGAVTGRDNIQNFIAGFVRRWESTEWDIITLLADGDTLTVERLDRTVVAGAPVNLPALGVFEMENGKIKVWRDYFDLTTYTDAFTAALTPAGN